MSLPIYRDIDGELHAKHETSVHHVFARSLTGGGKPRKFINKYPLTPRMLDVFHNEGPDALHKHVGLLRPPDGFVLHALQGVLNDLDSMGQYNQLIEFTDRVDTLAHASGNLIIRKECGRISENLALQMPYILLGQVERVME